MAGMRTRKPLGSRNVLLSREQNAIAIHSTNWKKETVSVGINQFCVHQFNRLSTQ
jgi:hypothetical protein